MVRDAHTVGTSNKNKQVFCGSRIVFNWSDLNSHSNEIHLCSLTFHWRHFSQCTIIVEFRDFVFFIRFSFFTSSFACTLFFLRYSPVSNNKQHIRSHISKKFEQIRAWEDIEFVWNQQQYNQSNALHCTALYYTIQCHELNPNRKKTLPSRKKRERKKEHIQFLLKLRSQIEKLPIKII